MCVLDAGVQVFATGIAGMASEERLVLLHDKWFQQAPTEPMQDIAELRIQAGGASWKKLKNSKNTAQQRRRN